ncbi:uncharacterized protein LOC142356802, partial [Convolutriloba macropyga]|uniref:uncharacterized protein LOC142356802 n=1 Tax=Convolutriloba macropyga TaxID=536237 RepID=UPI003F522B29
MTNSTETICLLEPPGQDQKDTKLSYSSSTPSEPLKSDSISETIANAPINRYHVITMVTVFAGYCGRNALLDMTPVLSTRLFVEMNLTPEMESALATVTFIGMTISYLFTGCISTLDMHVCEVMPSKYTWTAILLSVYGGEAMGKLLPYIAGLALLSSTSSHSWPYFVMALSIPSLLFIGLALIFIHDSPIYLLSVNKTDEARKSLEKIISRGSHSKLEGGNCTQVGVMDSEIEPMESFECFKYIFKDSYVLRSLICATVTGFSVKYTTYQLSYIVTELVFLSGQTDSDYCSGSE